MKTLLETFKKSLYNPAFYRGVAEAPFGEALRYYIKVSLALSLFMAVMFSILLVPYGVRFIKNDAPELVKKYYPSDLVVTTKGGEVSVNVAEPYVVSMQGEMKGVLNDQNTSLENIIVIDTKNEFTTEAFNEYKTLILLTKTEVITRESSGKITIQDIRNTPDMVLDQNEVLSWVTRVQDSLWIFVAIGIILTFVSLFIGFGVYLVPVLLFALVPFLIGWMRKLPLTYAGAYKMSLYAVVPGLVLKSLLNSALVFFVPSYLTFLVFLLIISLNMREVEQPKLFNS